MWLARFGCGDAGDEAVAAARNGLDEAGAFRGVAQDFAQAIDGFFERQLVIHKGVTGPKTLAKLFAGDDFARVFQQGLQDLERLAHKLLPQAGFADFAGLQVHFKDAEPHDARRNRAGGYW